MRITKDDSQPTQFSYEPAYFWVNLGEGSGQETSYMTPVIGIDLTQLYALSGLAHEVDHMKMWKERYDQLHALNLDHKIICSRIDYEMGTTNYHSRSENRAMAAEMRIERLFPNHPYMQTDGIIKPTEYFHFGYVNRMSYDDFEELKNEMKKDSYSEERAMSYMRKLVAFAHETKARALELPPETIDPRWKAATIYDLLVRPAGIERLEFYKTKRRFQSLLIKACEEFGISECIEAKDIVQSKRQ